MPAKSSKSSLAPSSPAGQNSQNPHGDVPSAPKSTSTSQTENRPAEALTAENPEATRREMLAYAVLGLIALVALVLFVQVGTVEAALGGTIIIFLSRSLVVRVMAGAPAPIPSLHRNVVIVGPSDDQNSNLGSLLSSRWKDAYIIVCLQKDKKYVTSRTSTKYRQKSIENSQPVSEVLVDVDDLPKAAQDISDIVNENGIWSVINLAVPGPGFECQLGDVEIVNSVRYHETMKDVTTNILIVKSLLPLVRKGNGRIITIQSHHSRLPSPFCFTLNLYQVCLSTLNATLRAELKRFSIRHCTIEAVTGLYVTGKAGGKRNTGAESSRDRNTSDKSYSCQSWKEAYDLGTPTTLEEYGETYLEYMSARNVEHVNVNHPRLVTSLDEALWNAQPSNRYTVICTTNQTSFIQRYPHLSRILPDWFIDSILMFDHKDSPLPNSAPDPHDDDD